MNELLDEIEIIRILSAHTRQTLPRGTEGIGDDCAVLPVSASESWVVSTDMLTEGTHFLLDKIPPRQLGYKTLAVNISDIAAMGASPIGSFLSISVNRQIDRNWLAEFSAGYGEASKACSMPLLGGDTVSSRNGIVLNVTVIGKADNRHIKRRNGAKTDDMIFVLDNLGDSAGGLKIIQSSAGPRNAEEEMLVLRHYRPPLFLREAQWLGTLPQVHAMMDLSDGIAKDLRHILEASGVGADINTAAIPISSALQTLSREQGYDALQLALCGGEDYSLLFTVENGFADAFERLFHKKFGYLPHRIGRITSHHELLQWLNAEGHPLNRNFYGYTHQSK